MTELKKMNKKEFMMINPDMVFLLRNARSVKEQDILKRIVERISSVRNAERKNIQQIAATTALADQRVAKSNIAVPNY